MKERREQLDATLEELQAAETAFRQAVVHADEARVLVSASLTLKARAEVETGRELLLQRAAAAEAANEAYRLAFDSEYSSGMRKATTRSRKLHEQRLELEQALADLGREIEAANAEEAPAITELVTANGFYFQYWQYASEIQARAVRLVHETRVAA